MTVYVIFRPSKYTHWYTRWLDRRFKHCFLLFDYGNQCLLIEHLQDGNWQELINDKALNELSRLDEYIAVKYTDRNVNISSKYLPRMCFSCVGLCMSFLGIKGLIFTPKQLYNRLIKLDNTEILINN